MKSQTGRSRGMFLVPLETAFGFIVHFLPVVEVLFPEIPEPFTQELTTTAFIDRHRLIIILKSGDFLNNNNMIMHHNCSQNDVNEGYQNGNMIYTQPSWNNSSQNNMILSAQGNTSAPQAISIYSAEENMPETMTNTAYIPAYLRHQIGRWMRIEFLVGNILEEKVGQLLDVGASYLILKMLEPATTMLCDLYSIKFITIIYDVKLERLYTR
jgi:hypothetical protein